MIEMRRTSAKLFAAAVWMVATLVPLTAAAADAPADPAAKKPIEVIVYPILVEAVVFGASVNLPSIPSLPGGGGGGTGSGESGAQSGTTNVSLNSLYMAGVAVRADRWFGEARGQWADLSASAATPHVTVDTRGRFFMARGGVMLVDGFSVTGGLRRIWGALDVSLTLPNIGNKVLQGSADKALYDPLVGVDWHRRVGNWGFDGNFQGGGFGVGTDADVSAEFNASWRFTSHTDLRLGYGLFYYKLTSDPIGIGSFQRTFTSSQTLHGPSLGFGIVF